MDPRTFDADLMSEMLSAMGKELKLARAKIHSLESQDYQKRAESAEYALDVMKKNFEEVCLENRRLQATLDELRDSKVWIKKDLEQALETYYQKYRAQKDSKNQLRETCRELEEKLLKIEAEMNEQKLSKETKEAAKASTGVQTPKSWTVRPVVPVVPAVMANRKDVHNFMLSLPNTVSNQFSGSKWKPVCNTSMDLKAFLAKDPRCKEVATNLLYLPGRVVRCPPAQLNAYAVGPRYLYNPLKQTLSKNTAAFDGLYGQTFHLFYTWRESIYYAGLYKGIDLRSEAPEGISVSSGNVSWEAIAEATLGGFSAPKINRLLATLYQEGSLRVEVLGLQWLECDTSIYDMLTSTQPTMNPVGKFGGYFPEATQEDSDEPKRKKQKIVF
ncbi:hypothetical protein BJ912DRAFT_983005 [Pholiota molesta]|nr:hypothetical protein BJ912DRAFT_983005 [Pholiota molesta]